MKFTVVLELKVIEGPKRLDPDDVAAELEAELDALSFDVGDSCCEVTAKSVVLA